MLEEKAFASQQRMKKRFPIVVLLIGTFSFFLTLDCKYSANRERTHPTARNRDQRSGCFEDESC